VSFFLVDQTNGREGVVLPPQEEEEKTMGKGAQV
jgi:hypothetical protein